VQVIVPTLNERENLPSLAEAVFAQPVGADLLIVDDNSPDGTGALADELAGANPRLRVLHRPGPHGHRQRASRLPGVGPREHDAVVTMDADWSHDPAYLRRWSAGRSITTSWSGRATCTASASSTGPSRVSC
jgi:dolichol-phosphate mannosyltransferase